jgi:transcription initiation factor TFIID TATA-box-binding protein
VFPHIISPLFLILKRHIININLIFKVKMHRNHMQGFKFELVSKVKIQNMVTTADLKQVIDIASFNEYEYLSSNLKLYRCGYVKDNKMVGRVTVFENGKLISVGTKSPEQSIKELRKASRILQKYNLSKSTKIIPLVRNIVSRFDLQRKLDIEQLARTLPKSMYEPEMFPGLVYRIQDSCVALLFSSGKGMIVGAKTIKEVNVAFYEINTKTKI